MGKHLITAILRILTIIMTICLLAGSLCFADIPVSAGRTIVKNLLPDVVLYAATDEEYNATAENLTVYVNNTKTKVQWAGTFADTGEGVSYYMMIDVSRSIKEEDFENIKKNIIDFCNSLSEKDSVYLMPFGESVYTDKTEYVPGSSELKKTIDGLSLKDDYTQLYAAMDAVTDMALQEKTELKRNIAMVFTDGLDDTTGGLITRDEAIAEMNDAAIPLYAFAVGSDKAGKDSIGVITRDTGGNTWDMNNSSSENILEDFKNTIDKSVTIKAKVQNSEDIADSFTVRVTKDGTELLVIENVRAHKTDDTKDSFGVAAIKIFNTYWWIIAILFIMLIAVIVLKVIKKNKGIVTIDGKVVYGSKIQQQYHMKVKEYNSKNIVMGVSINGSKTIEQPVTVNESIIVGRSDTCDVYFDDISVSRQHFSIELEDGAFYITDLESTSGTYLNGVRLAGRQRINSGDQIDAGRVRIKVIF